MSTINDLSVVSSVSSADKLPVWSNANGVTRGLPISVLDNRYLTQDQLNELKISPTPEIFSAGDGIVPNTFVPGTTFSLVLANLYGSGDNIDVFFDGTFQGSDQWGLSNYSLIFTSPIPVGVSKVYVKGGAARITNGVSAGSITDASLSTSSKLYTRINNWVDVKDPQFGAKGDGVTDDTVAINAADVYATSRGLGLYFPGGTYMVSQAAVTMNGASWFGSGKFNSVIKAKAETYATNLTGMVSCNSKSGFSVHDMGFDISLPTYPPGTHGVNVGGNIYWALSLANCTNWNVTDCAFTGIQQATIGLLANGGSYFDIERNYFHMPSPIRFYNNAINIVTTPSFPAMNYKVTGNIMDGCGLDSNGSFGVVSRNYITGVQYGSGLVFGPLLGAICNVIVDNVILNGAGFDENNTWPNGIECWSQYSVIANNICGFNSGNGIGVGCDHVTIANNICFSNGQTAGSGGSGINCVSISTDFNGSNNLISGNICFDTQTVKTQQYGYYEYLAGGPMTGNTLVDNNFNGNAVGTSLIASTKLAYRGPQLYLATTAGPGPIITGTQVAATYSMAGVAYGDTVKVAYAGDLGGVIVSGYVNAPGSVVVIFANNTGATQTLASRALNIWVEKALGYTSIA